jgi:hypothetical protein
MAYLRCQQCGITVFDRNPLTSPGRCPRCTACGDSDAHLERVLQLRAGAAGSVLDGAAEPQSVTTEAANEAPA